MNETDGPELGILILLSLALQEPMVECCLLGVWGPCPCEVWAPSSSPQPSFSTRTHVYMCACTLTFRFSCWISASVTACLIWSCRQRVALSA